MAATSNLNQTNVEQQAFISVRLVTMDHYMSDPVTSDLDPVYSSFRSSPVRKVPVLRIFGPTSTGQKTCLHIHGILPYMFVPKPEEADHTFPFRLATSLDKALNISLLAGLNKDDNKNDSRSSQQHIFKIVEVRGRPFYGYHPREHLFYKLFFYNPWMIKRAADILQNGAVMGRVLQPHFSHVPYTLQFMMDYNLQGMNMIHLRHCLFRRDKNYVGLTSEVNLSLSDENKPNEGAGSKYFDLRNSPASELLLPDNVERMSISELEIDAVAADILNTNDDLMSQTFSLPEDMSPLSLTPPLMKSKHALLSGKKKKLTNPGLEALWIDERMRRATLLEDILDDKESLSPPDSPPRTRTSDWKSDSQLFWEDRFSSLIEDFRTKGLLDVTDDPNDMDPDSTANFLKSTKKPSVSDKEKHLDPIVYPEEVNEDELQFLQEATELDYHVSSLSQTILGTSRLDISKKNIKSGGNIDEQSISKNVCLEDTVVDEDILSQTISQSLSQTESDNLPVFDEDETELMDLLNELGKERLLYANDLSSDEINSKIHAKSPEKLGNHTSQSQFLTKKQFDQDVQDTLEMSQVWDSDAGFDTKLDEISQNDPSKPRSPCEQNSFDEAFEASIDDIFSSSDRTKSSERTPPSQNIETDIEDFFASSQPKDASSSSSSSKIKRAKVTFKKRKDTSSNAIPKSENKIEWDDDSFWDSVNFDTKQ